MVHTTTTVGTGVASPSESAYSVRDGAADALIETMASLMDDGTAGGVALRARTMPLVSGLVRALDNLRQPGVPFDIDTIRDSLSLNEIYRLFVRGEQGELSEPAVRDLRDYLDHLPLWDWEKAHRGQRQRNTVIDHHGYLVMYLEKLFEQAIERQTLPANEVTAELATAALVGVPGSSSS